MRRSGRSSRSSSTATSASSLPMSTKPTVSRAAIFFSSDIECFLPLWERVGLFPPMPQGGAYSAPIRTFPGLVPAAARGLWFLPCAVTDRVLGRQGFGLSIGKVGNRLGKVHGVGGNVRSVAGLIRRVEDTDIASGSGKRLALGISKAAKQAVLQTGIGGVVFTQNGLCPGRVKIGE